MANRPRGIWRTLQRSTFLTLTARYNGCEIDQRRIRENTGTNNLDDVFIFINARFQNSP